MIVALIIALILVAGGGAFATYTANQEKNPSSDADIAVGAVTAVLTLILIIAFVIKVFDSPQEDCVTNPALADRSVEEVERLCNVSR